MELINECKYSLNLPATTVETISRKVLDLCQVFRQQDPSEDKANLYKRISSSGYLQQKYLERNLGLTIIQPQTHQTMVDSQGQEYQYKYTSVPIEALCRKVLQNEFVRNKLLEEAAQSRTRQPLDTKINSLKDTTSWPRLQGKLKLELYIDDCQLAPTLCFNQNQKHIFVYATFPDLPYRHRCRKEDIEMVLMANRAKLVQLKEHGLSDPIAALLTGIKNEIKSLMEHGITITVNGQPQTFEVALSAICGDNAGIFELLGMLS